MTKICIHKNIEKWFGFPKNQRKNFKNNHKPNKYRIFCNDCNKIIEKGKIK